MGECPVDEVLNITGFNMNDVLDVDPAFFNNDHHMHHHNDDIHSFVYESDRPFNPMKLERYSLRSRASTVRTCFATRAFSI